VPQPRTLRVGPGAEYAAPAEALAAAAPHDTVRVAAGIYAGALTLERPVVLVGEPGAVLDGGGKGTAVTIASDSVVVRGFTIRDSGRSLDHDDAAVKLVRCKTGCRVEENHLVRPLHGIYLLESDGVVLAGNRIDGNAALPENRRGNAIHLFDSQANRIERNVIRDARDGMYFTYSGDNVVTDNDVSRTRYGLHYMYSNDNRFERNRFTRNAAGAAIMLSRRLVFRDNVFADHVGYRAYGVLLQTAYDIEAERNRFEGNLTGIFFDMSSRNTFHHNVIAGNGIGIDMLSSSEDNTFHDNAIVGNRTAVRIAEGGGQNAWTKAGRGNFWGDRSVFDLDGDGIGDRPYRAGDPFATLAGLRPVLEVFAGTPAAYALSWAEEAFPVFGVPRVEDEAPLTAAPEGQPAPIATDAGARVAPRVAVLALIAGVIVALALTFQALSRRQRPRAVALHRPEEAA
jgi:nitrous oxidase accessory protein